VAKKRKKKAAKAPPPRKAVRTPMQVPPGGPGRPPKSSIEYEGDPTSYPYLRALAGEKYITDMDQGSIADWQRTPLFQIIPLETMQRWSAQDGWVEKRRVFFDSIRKRAEAKLGTVLAQARFEQLKESRKVKDVAFNLIVKKGKKAVLEAKSMEGMINAYTKLIQVIDEQSEKLADMVLPEPAASLEGSDTMLPVVRPRLSQEEAAAAALTIVRMRREEMRAAMRSEEAEKKGEVAPHMRVIDGEK